MSSDHRSTKYVQAASGTGRRPGSGEDASTTEEIEERVPLSSLHSVGEEVAPSGSPAEIPAQLGDFQILSEIGRGSMGVVYEALQLSLERRVAIKVLPREMTSHPVRMKRFVREAKALAALDHPNIVTVHTVETVGDICFLTMARIEGRTLSRVIPSRGMPLDELLDVSIQLADALDAAHQQGIVHRDLKPANVMITPKRQIMILDFGLAKLWGEPGQREKSPTVESSQELTRFGATLGTVPYMSPEQVEAKPVDSRSDLFSLGVMIFLMATGHHPFRRKSAAETMSAIRHEDAPPLTQLKPDLPGDLVRIVHHCLRKDADQRFQTARGLHGELAELRESLDSSQAERRPRPPLPMPAKLGIVAASIVALLAIAVGVDRWIGPERLPQWTPARVTTTPVWDFEPEISPDGRDIAFAVETEGNSDVWIMDAAGGHPLRRTSHAARDSSPAWLADGRKLVFTSDRSGAYAIWKMDRYAGPPTMLIPDARDPAVSPDGRRIAFVRPDSTGSLRVFVAPLDRPDDVVQLTHEGEGSDDHRRPAWSPDSATLVYNDFFDLWRVRASGGSAGKLTRELVRANHAAWSPSGWIYFHSRYVQQLALWRVRPDGSRLERVTPSTSSEFQPSLSRDGRRLAHTTRIPRSELWLLDLDTGARSRVETTAHNPWGPGFSSDGRLMAFCAADELWIQPLEDGRPHGESYRLLDHPDEISLPVVSSDGRWIAYSHVSGQERDIWVVPSHGGTMRRVTRPGDVDLHASWSPDGSRLVYASDRSGGPRLWIAELRDGRPAGHFEQLTDGDAVDYLPQWSPDGSRIAFIRNNDVWLVPPSAGAEAVRVTDGIDARFAIWGGALDALFVSGTWGGQELEVRKVDVATGRVESLPHEVRMGSGFASGDFAVSPNRGLMAYEVESFRGDIWVLDAGRDRF